VQHEHPGLDWRAQATAVGSIRAIATTPVTQATRLRVVQHCNSGVSMAAVTVGALALLGIAVDRKGGRDTTCSERLITGCAALMGCVWLKRVLAGGRRHVRPLVPAPSSPRFFSRKGRSKLATRSSGGPCSMMSRICLVKFTDLMVASERGRESMT
jgi:hypothetical protein